MADMTDEEALAEAERALWTFRALSKLEEVIRYTRDARKDVSILQQKVVDLNADIVKYQNECEAWAARLERTAAETKPVIEELTNRKNTLTAEVQKLESALADSRSSAQTLAQRINDDQARANRLSERIADLSAEAKNLERTIAEREAKLAELRSLAAKLSE